MAPRPRTGRSAPRARRRPARTPSSLLVETLRRRSTGPPPWTARRRLPATWRPRATRPSPRMARAPRRTTPPAAPTRPSALTAPRRHRIDRETPSDVAGAVDAVTAVKAAVASLADAAVALELLQVGLSFVARSATSPARRAGARRVSSVARAAGQRGRLPLLQRDPGRRRCSVRCEQLAPRPRRARHGGGDGRCHPLPDAARDTERRGDGDGRIREPARPRRARRGGRPDLGSVPLG